MRKKTLIFALSALLVLASLAGCSSFDGDETAMTVGDDVVTADLANFAARYMQAQYETYYGAYLGDDMWSSEAEEGLTYEEYVKENVQNTLKVMLLCEQHQGDYDIELTDPEKRAIEQAAADFSDSNSLDAKEKVSGDTETVERFMTLSVEEGKVADAVEAGADTDVSDEEAAQKAMSYVRFPKNTTDDDGNTMELSEEELEDLKAEAQELVDRTLAGEDFDQVATELDLNVQTTTFDADSTVPDASVVEAADALENVRAVTDVIETEGSYFVAQLTSLMDQEATETKKEEIIEERKEELFGEVLDGWEEDTEVTINDSVWNKINFKTMSVTSYTDESDDYTDPIETDDVAEENLIIEEDEEEEVEEEE